MLSHTILALLNYHQKAGNLLLSWARLLPSSSRGVGGIVAVHAHWL
jgi:hypothetical protein